MRKTSKALSGVSPWAALALALAVLPFALSACAQEPKPSEPRPAQAASERPAQAARGLAHYEITPATLPPPDMSHGAENPPRVVPRPAGAQLTMPPGFEIGTFAEGFDHPRWLALGPNGDVFVAESRKGQIILLRDTNDDGAADTRLVFAENLNQPFGMAVWRDYFYVANTDAVVRFPYQVGQTRVEGRPEQITELPGGGYRQHWTRNIAFSPDGSKLYVTVGSESNVSVEPEPRAAILEMNPDGTGRRIFASGLRNPIGLAFYPGTGTLWAAVQERDRIGDDIPPDYVTSVKEGGFYGWPYSYIGQNEDPRRRGERPELVKTAIVPDVLIQAHSAILGLVIYDGPMFPAEYRGDAFAALHGSWNRSKRTGYKIIRIPMENGRPAGGYDDFVTGWMLDENRPEVWGRPVGLLVLGDGSMLISDDGADKIWRVTYREPARTSEGKPGAQ